MSKVVTTGPNGQAPRLEINELIQDRTQWSLYIRALQKMFDTSQDQSTSFFSIGAIHGQPFEAWPGAGEEDPATGERWGGYCTHGTVIFPTWHRPYMSLFEQVLHGHALEVAQQYTVDKPKFQASAESLRAPYWDWVANAVPPDEVIAKPRINIIGFDGRDEEIANPLWGYVFHPFDDGISSEWRRFPKTVRNPNRRGQDDPTSLKRVLAANADQLKEKVRNLLFTNASWNDISNHGPTGGNADSLEGIHDDIHVFVGRGGHMNVPTVAAFDPIFWLHHANVDRLLALWQAMHPGEWVTEGETTGGTWTVKAGATLGVTSALTPFWQSPTEFFTSATTQDWRTLNYDYPEFAGLELSNTAAVQDAITDKVTELYGAIGSATFLAMPKAAGARLDSMAQRPLRSLQTPSSARERVDQSSYVRWGVRVQANHYAIRESFSVLFFLAPDEGEKAGDLGPSYVGAVAAFVNPDVDRCENCRDHDTANAQFEGFVFLNHQIAARSGLESFDPEEVVPWIKDKLAWCVEKGDGTPVPIEAVSSLTVTLTSSTLILRTGAKMPTFGQTQDYELENIGIAPLL